MDSVPHRHNGRGSSNHRCTLMNETFLPVFLIEKANELRRRTKNWGIHVMQEEIEIALGELLRKNLSRPLMFLFTEPIVLCLSIYMEFLYDLLYLFLTAYPIVFRRIHGFERGVSVLPYLGLVIGEFIGGFCIPCVQPLYNRKLDGNYGIPIPEWRLPPAILESVAFSGGLFWFGWSRFTAKFTGLYRRHLGSGLDLVCSVSSSKR